MRTGIILVALLGSTLTASTALADRSNDYDNNKTTRSHEVKESVKEAVEHVSERAEKPSASTGSSAQGSSTSARVVAQALKSRNKNDEQMADDNGAPSTSKSSHSNGQSAASQQVSARIVAKALKNRNKNDEQMADENGASNKSNSSGKTSAGNPTWTAAGKTIRNFVHMMNDKGQINSSMKGATATAGKNRAAAAVIFAPLAAKAGRLFKWMGSGGDHSEDAEP